MLWPKATLALEDRRKWERGELVHRDVDKELRGMGVSLNLGIHRDTPVGLGRQDAPSGSAKNEHLTMPAASTFSHVGKPAKRPASAPPWLDPARVRDGLAVNVANPLHSSSIRPVKYHSTSKFSSPSEPAAWEADVRAAFPCLTLRPRKANFDDIQLARSKERWEMRKAWAQGLGPWRLQV